MRSAILLTGVMALEGLHGQLVDGSKPSYERSDVAEEVFELWLDVAADFTQGRLAGGRYVPRARARARALLLVVRECARSQPDRRLDRWLAGWLSVCAARMSVYAFVFVCELVCLWACACAVRRWPA